jgi:hypothetical protein
MMFYRSVYRHDQDFLACGASSMNQGLITLAMMVGSDQLAEGFDTIADYRQYILRVISDLEGNWPEPRQALIQLAERIADKAVLGVCELPDYTSPDDQPDLLQCTVDELHLQVMNAVESCMQGTPT